MSVAPNSGIVDFGVFTPPLGALNGIQGQVPAPLTTQASYILTAQGWASAGSIGLVGYQGTWDALNNVPPLTSSVGTQGYYYVVSVAGTTNLNGITDWQVGDWAIYNGSAWQKVDNTDSYNPANVAITGGTINGTTIGASNATTGAFTTLTSTGGALNGTIGATTPAAGTFTTITGQTEVLRGTGQNFLLQSQTFESASWTKSSSFITADQVAAPDGTTTADYFYATNPSSVFPSVTQAFTCTTNQTYTFSLYVRSAERTTCTIQAYGNSSVYINGFDATGLTSAWTRITLTVNSSTYTSLQLRIVFSGSSVTWTGSQGIYIWGAQAELASTAGTYLATTTTAIYGTPTLSFSGVAGLGLQSDGSLYVSPAGTGALQAQATDSAVAGGNARGVYTNDWQRYRLSATQVASGQYATIGGGSRNTIGNNYSTIGGGDLNTITNNYATIAGGYANAAQGYLSAVGAGGNNTASGVYNYIGGGYYNSGTVNAAVTSQSGTMNGTTSVTLSGSNANIKVGQFITGTSIATNTYVSAISGTALTLSQVASGSSTSTLSFFTPHGVVVGGGNNQATGSYSFIGGGGDAGTSSNRNVASGDWSFVGGGWKNNASQAGAVICGGGILAGINYGNTNSGQSAGVVAGLSNNASGNAAFIGAGYNNVANSQYGTVTGGSFGTTRSIVGNHVFSACVNPISQTSGINQSALLVLARQTTDATATVLCSDNNAAGTTNQVILPNNSAYYFKGSVIANVTGASAGAAWSFEGAIMRGAGVGTTVLIGTPMLNRVAASSGASAWSIAITADTTNGGLAITVTGVTGTTIRWVASVNTVEVTF